MSLLPFAQLDLPGRLALADGRYVVRPPGDAEAAADVLAIRTLGAARTRTRLSRGRAVAVEQAPGATPLPLARVTLIKARPFGDEAGASAWLEKVSASEELYRGLAEELGRTLNRALQAQRAASRDPYVAEIHPRQAVAIRFGYGSGNEVADGRWRGARELSAKQREKLAHASEGDVGPLERVAAVLGARDEVGPAEEMLLAAARALSERRLAHAAVQLAAACEQLERERVAEAAELAGRARALRDGSADPDERALRKVLSGALALAGKRR